MRKRELEARIVAAAREIAYSHYAGEHPDLGEGWVVRAETMAELRRLYGLLDKR